MRWHAVRLVAARLGVAPASDRDACAGDLENAAEHLATPGGRNIVGPTRLTVGQRGSLPPVWQLGRCRHGTTSGVRAATYDSHVTKRPCPIRESSQSTEGDVRRR